MFTRTTRDMYTVRANPQLTIDGLGSVYILMVLHNITVKGGCCVTGSTRKSEVMFTRTVRDVSTVKVNIRQIANAQDSPIYIHTIAQYHHSRSLTC